MTNIPLSATLLLCLILVHVAGCSHTPKPTQSVFKHNHNELAARLILPSGVGPHPAVVIVHGDGEMTWDAFGYYTPMIQSLTRAGFAVYSWDKPGVGASTGNWLHQSMQDRAAEVLGAVAQLRNHSSIRPHEIGLLGFSQAGWVMPKALAADRDLAFMVSVSGAINWREQSAYMTRNRLRLAGASETDIQQALEFDRRIESLLGADAPYETYESAMRGAPDCCTSVMSRDRWAFAKLNFRSDAREDLRGVAVPVLALFGDKDMNVDFAQSAAVYQDILSNTPGIVRVEILGDADHSLLPALEDRLVTVGPELTQRVVAIHVFGADAFAGGAVELITQWISALDTLAPRDPQIAGSREVTSHE